MIVESTTRKSERERNAERMRRERAAYRDVQIPRPADRRRRDRLERDIFAWLRWYFHEIFTDDFQPHQREMIAAILYVARYGGDQAIAAPRGDGKTTFAECVILYAVLTGLVRFPVIFSATGPDAERILGTIRGHLEENERLRADYPEVCIPIDALENNPSRAHGQTVSGCVGRRRFTRARSKFRWCGREITLPNVPGSRCAGSIIATRGLDAAVRGLKFGNLRPDLAAIDDPDTDDTATSEDQAAKLARRIDRNIGGLAGQRKRLARIMLTTLLNRRCVSAEYTDPRRRPAWKGRRFKFLVSPPARQDLWEEYLTIRQAAQRDGDPWGRAADDFYLERRSEMDAGAELANPSRFHQQPAPDGRPIELSALHHYYNFVADNGLAAALSELQNDPEEEAGQVEAGLSGHRVQTQVSGIPRRIVPREPIVALAQGIDVGKFALHWVVTAWRADATGYVIDYGVQEVWGTTRGSDEAVDVGIQRALYARRDQVEQNPYTLDDGQVVPIATTLVDAGYRTEAIYQFCREVGLAFIPAMGFGRSTGAAKINFSMPKESEDKKPGERFFLHRKGPGLWLCCTDADHWKRWIHDRFLTPAMAVGSLQLFGESSGSDHLSDDQRGHFAFAKHITNEIEVEDFVRGKGLVRRWKVKSDTNHYLDALYMSAVAGAMRGASLARRVAPRPSSARSPATARPTARSKRPRGKVSYL